MFLLKLLFVILIFLSSTLFAMANKDLVSVVLYPSTLQIEIPIFLLIFVSVITGVLLCSVFCYIVYFSNMKELLFCKSKVKALEDEVKNIKLEQRVKGSYG